MKKIILAISAVFLMSDVVAQEIATREFVPEGKIENELMAAPSDSLHLPAFDRLGNLRLGFYPMEWGGMYNWDLHKGFNMSLGASVFAAFGKHAPKGAGFNQNVAAMYAVPLSSRLSVAVGGYFSNTSWLHDNFHDAGLSAVLGYRFNEHWEAYVFGQKSLVDKRRPLPIYDINNVGDRFGAAVKYNFNPSFSVYVSVSKGERYYSDWWY